MTPTPWCFSDPFLSPPRTRRTRGSLREELKTAGLEPLKICGSKVTWYRPTDLASLLLLKQADSAACRPPPTAPARPQPNQPHPALGFHRVWVGIILFDGRL